MAAIPPYIEIYNEAGARVAVLSPQADGLKDCVIDRELNGSCTLSFSLPATCPKAAYLTERCRIVAEGREFVLLDPGSITQVREGKRLWVQVQAQESWVLLGRIYKTIPADNVPLAVEILSATAAQALSALLEGTGWALESCDVEGVHDLELEKEPVLTCIRKVAETWGGYLIWDSLEHRVSLVKEPGQDRGYQIRYAKNLKGVTRTVDPDVITRLYPFGENDLNIATVNNGQIYLEDFTYTPEVREGIWIDQSIDDPAELKARAQEVLARVSRPRANYRIDMVDLRTLPEHAHEVFDVGDWVRVIDPELGIDAKMRVIRRKWYVFQPWRCEVEVGDVLESTLAQHLASMRQATDFVRKALLANPGARNLAKGFIDAFATEINTRRGKLVWSGDVLEAIEVDANGTPTGKRVRITPGGIGISEDGGQTYRTAMTGAGILANTVIVSELYALATDDGLTKLAGDGLHVYDRNLVERLVAGRWLEGTVEHFGLRVKAQDGQTVLLDDRGLLQTWQEGRTENVDGTHPLTLYVYLPPEARAVKKALLRLKLLPFRAYTAGSTTSSGGGTTVSISQNTTGPSSTSTATGGGHTHDTPGETTGPFNWGTPESHYHTFLSVAQYSGDHSHDMSHTHDMSHSHTIGSHSHGIPLGFTEGAVAQNVTVKINGVDRTGALGGPFSTDQTALDITPYLIVGQWNTIELGASGQGRIDAGVFIQALLGVA